MNRYDGVNNYSDKFVIRQSKICLNIIGVDKCAKKIFYILTRNNYSTKYLVIYIYKFLPNFLLHIFKIVHVFVSLFNFNVSTLNRKYTFT